MPVSRGPRIRLAVWPGLPAPARARPRLAAVVLAVAAVAIAVAVHAGGWHLSAPVGTHRRAGNGSRPLWQRYLELELGGVMALAVAGYAYRRRRLSSMTAGDGQDPPGPSRGG